jgi:hypothetical protein
LACCFWKQERHSTGLPWVGLNGTVVSALHSEQVVRVSERTLRPPRARFALHCLQCLGSFLNCLSWKNNCSPAVNTNSAPQSMHFNTLSVNSMAGFPETGNCAEIGHEPRSLPVPFPCLRTRINNKGPGRNKFSGYLLILPSDREDYESNPPGKSPAGLSHKRDIVTGRPGPVFVLTLALAVAAGETGRLCHELLKLVLLFASLLAIPLARQSRLYAFLLAGLQVVGVTLDFLDDVLLLYLPLEPAQRIFQRLAFLYANLCQKGSHLQTCLRGLTRILEKSDFG